MIGLTIFAISFVFVFCKAFQQRNVVFNNWKLIPLFSYLMATLELAGMSIGVLDIAENGWSRLLVLGFCSGTGGTLGCWLAIYTHKKHNLS